MGVCTFFGHRDCPDTVRPRLRETLVRLIEAEGVDLFYVGNHGAFDAMVHLLLRELEKSYPHIRYAVVLAYLPRKRADESLEALEDTMLPEGIESVPRRYAINWRNKWMLTRADWVIVYQKYTWGGAAAFSELARKRKKRVINLAEEEWSPGS